MTKFLFKEVAELLVYTAAGIGVIYAMSLKLFKNFKGHLGTAIKTNKEIHLILKECRLALRSDRCDLLYSSNGGGKPKAGKSIFVTLVDESISIDQTPYIGLWDKQRADRGYQDIISRIISYNHHDVVEVDTIEDSIIKQAIQALDLEYCIFVAVKDTGKEFYFMVHSWEKPVEITPKMRELIRIYKNKVAALLK